MEKAIDWIMAIGLGMVAGSLISMGYSVGRIARALEAIASTCGS